MLGDKILNKIDGCCSSITCINESKSVCNQIFVFDEAKLFLSMVKQNSKNDNINDISITFKFMNQLFSDLLKEFNNDVSIHRAVRLYNFLDLIDYFYPNALEVNVSKKYWNIFETVASCLHKTNSISNSKFAYFQLYYLFANMQCLTVADRWGHLLAYCNNLNSTIYNSILEDNSTMVGMFILWIEHQSDLSYSRNKDDIVTNNSSSHQLICKIFDKIYLYIDSYQASLKIKDINLNSVWFLNWIVLVSNFEYFKLIFELILKFSPKLLENLSNITNNDMNNIFHFIALRNIFSVSNYTAKERDTLLIIDYICQYFTSNVDNGEKVMKQLLNVSVPNTQVCIFVHVVS